MFTRTLMSTILAAGVAGAAFAADVDTSEAKDFAKAPDAVQTALKKEYPKGTVTNFAEKKEDGVVVYKATVKDDTGSHDVYVSADGKIHGAKGDGAELAAAPAAVQEAIKKQFPNGRVTDFDAKKEDGVPMYEATVQDGNVKHEIVLTADGKIHKDETKAK